MRILVSGASTIVGYGILRALRSGNSDLHLIGTTIYEDSAARGFCDKFILAPHTLDPGYADWLAETIRTEHVDLLFPGIDVDLYNWSEHREAIALCGATPVLNSHEVIELCRDKWKFFCHTCEILGPNAIETSLSNDYAELERMFGLPFLAKPREGYASKGIVRINDEASFTEIRDSIGSRYMIQPLVGSDDEEYTVSAFCDGTGGFATSNALRRKLGPLGYTENAETVPAQDFDPILTRLCQYLRPVGPTNFQFRRADGVFKLLEINPRISAATSIRCAFGYNEALMSVEFYRNGKLPTPPVIREGRAARYAEDFIFYS